MKHPSVIAAIVVGISLIISVSILSFALRDYGRSLVRAAGSQPNPTIIIPDHFRISFDSGNSPVRLNVNMTP